MRLFASTFALVLALAGCGGASETATGNGGFDFSDGGISDGGGVCVNGAACDVVGGLGACAKGKLSCETPAGTCVAAKPTAETCNGVDDNCDGTIDEGCALTLATFDATGKSIAKATTSSLFPVSGRASLALADVFMTDPGDGFGLVTSASPLPVGGTFFSGQTAGTDPHVLIPTVAPSQMVKSIIVPTYRFGGTMPGYAHAIALANTGKVAASVTFSTPAVMPARPDQMVMIPPSASLKTSVPQIFSIDPSVQEISWLSITSDQPLAYSYTETSTAFADVAGDAAWGAPGASLTLPYFASGGMADTTIRLANPAMTDVMAMVSLHPSAGASLQAMVGVPARAFVATPISTLFPMAFASRTEGWIEIVAATAVAATAFVEDTGAGGIALVGAVDALDTLHYIADASIDTAIGVTTDILLANPAIAATEVTLAAYAGDGSRVVKTSLVLGPRSSFAGSLGTVLGLSSLTGWVRVASDQPITGAYVRRDGAAGIGVTALQRSMSATAIVPDVESAANGQTTTVTLIQPERRAF